MACMYLCHMILLYKVQLNLDFQCSILYNGQPITINSFSFVKLSKSDAGKKSPGTRNTSFNVCHHHKCVDFVLIFAFPFYSVHCSCNHRQYTFRNNIQQFDINVVERWESNSNDASYKKMNNISTSSNLTCFVIYRKVNDVPFYVLILFRDEKRNAITCSVPLYPAFCIPYIIQCSQCSI